MRNTFCTNFLKWYSTIHFKFYLVGRHKPTLPFLYCHLLLTVSRSMTNWIGWHLEFHSSLQLAAFHEMFVFGFNFLLKRELWFVNSSNLLELQSVLSFFCEKKSDKHVFSVALLNFRRNGCHCSLIFFSRNLCLEQVFH